MESRSKIFQSLDDGALVEMYREGETEAFNVLLRRYSNRIRFYAYRFYYTGMTYQDSAQEGAIGLFNAVLRYQPERGSSFHSFAEVHIRGQVINAIKGASRKKHKLLNDSVSLDSTVTVDGEYTRMQVVRNTEPSPEEFFFQKMDEREEVRKINSILTTYLSNLERKAFLKIYDGQSYREAANEIGVTTKTIDNAMRRVRKKLSKVCSSAEAEQAGLDEQNNTLNA